jgi:hypothetical protein
VETKRIDVGETEMGPGTLIMKQTVQSRIKYFFDHPRRVHMTV